MVDDDERIRVRFRSPDGQEIAITMQADDKIERLRCILQWYRICSSQRCERVASARMLRAIPYLR
jgi:hypothetical protein